MSAYSQYRIEQESNLSGRASTGCGSDNTRVLIVEDGEIQRTTLADLLRLWGYDIETASDGLEALEKMPLFRPQVVISDLQMPRMGGIKLLEVLRSRVPAVACIIVTGYGIRGELEAVTALGAVDYLEKPLDLERLRTDLWRLAHSEDCRPARIA
jgi:CheY-like chemotaxis protein